MTLKGFQCATMAMLLDPEGSQHGWMDNEWMDGWMNGWTDGWMDGYNNNNVK